VTYSARNALIGVERAEPSLDFGSRFAGRESLADQLLRSIGTDWKATCRTEGDRWIHAFAVTDSSGPGQPTRHTFAEEWRRIE
jgi:hypothetical protein